MRAVLWDLDGTLVETGPYWVEAQIALLAQHSLPWTEEQGGALIGNDLRVTAQALIDQAGLPMDVRSIVDALVAMVSARVVTQVPWREGARELLLDLRDHGVRCGLVTMAPLEIVDPVVRALPDDTFSVVVTAERVTLGKPDPEAYATALADLAEPAAECVVIEDSGNGVRSAEGAGLRVLAVENFHPIPEGAARVVRDSFNGLNHAGLVKIFDTIPLPETRS